MFLRSYKRKKNGKEHRYWSVVENRRTHCGIVQRPVLYLGEINDSQREAWTKAITIFDETTDTASHRPIFPADAPLPEHAAAHGIQVDLKGMQLCRPRQWGACWLAGLLWDQLALTFFWKSRLPDSREGTSWLKVLQVLTFYRLIAPGAEWRLHRHWFDQTALADLLDGDFSLAAKDTLYRCHDLLLAHKDALFTHLSNQWRTLFNADYEVVLYDLTSTYFESSSDADGSRPQEQGGTGAKRRYGYSRDKRSDCVQIVIALVLTCDGFPLAYEVMPGNTIDNQTLRAFLTKIENQYGKAKRLWLMDRGIPTEEVLAEMRASNPPASYLVGTPKGRLTKLGAELADKPWQQVREDVRVKLLTKEGETYVLAQSEGRVAKERSMRRKRLRIYVETLRKLRMERKRPLTRTKLLLAIGAARKAAGNAGKAVRIELPEEGQPVTAETFSYSIDRVLLRQNETRDGQYLLRTNLTDSDPQALWQLYMQLVQVEEAFRNLKGDLGIRPVYHQLEHRIEAHIFISFQAFALHCTLKARLKALAPGLTPRSVLEKLATVLMLDVHLPTTEADKTLVMPRVTMPSEDVKLLLETLKLTLPPEPPPRLRVTKPQ